MVFSACILIACFISASSLFFVQYIRLFAFLFEIFNTCYSDAFYSLLFGMSQGSTLLAVLWLIIVISLYIVMYKER